MKHTDELFRQEIIEFISLPNYAPDKNIIKSKYLELVKKYHPDTNDKMDKNILHEYMTIINTAFEKKQNGVSMKTQKTSQETVKKDSGQNFDFRKFTSLFARYTSPHFYSCSEMFQKATQALVWEIKKSDKAVGEAFARLSTKEIMYTTSFRLYHSGLKYYVNRYVYTDAPVDNSAGEKIGDGFFVEYKDSCKKHGRFEEIKAAVDTVNKWLKAIHGKYNDTTSYKG